MSETAHSIAYEDLSIGQTASQAHSVSETDLQMFAAVSGDNNPVHLDDGFAAASRFKGRIAHGMFTGALLSAAIACKLPGPGSVYLGQQLSFMRPVKIGDELEVQLEVLEKLAKNQVRIRTRVINQQGKAVVDGEALVLAPDSSQAINMPELPRFQLQN